MYKSLTHQCTPWGGGGGENSTFVIVIGERNSKPYRRGGEDLNNFLNVVFIIPHGFAAPNPENIVEIGNDQINCLL